MIARRRTALVTVVILVALGRATGPRAAFARTVQAHTEAALHTCVVIEELNSAAVWRSDRELCRTRLSPASTFKIPHALVALETGVVTVDSVESWNGTPYPGQPLWERDHTVLSALKPSVVWFFQRIAPRIGASRMHDWLERFDYGNRRTDGDVTMYWLNGTLLISPDEQVHFLRRFYSERLPVSREPQQRVGENLVQPVGTVQNAQGVAALDGAWPADGRWSVKTGRTDYGRRSVSWLVGRVDNSDRARVFAAAAWSDETPVDPLDGARLAARTLLQLGYVATR